jgi:hypothetical protein
MEIPHRAVAVDVYSSALQAISRIEIQDQFSNADSIIETFRTCG